MYPFKLCTFEFDLEKSHDNNIHFDFTISISLSLTLSEDSQDSRTNHFVCNQIIIISYSNNKTRNHWPLKALNLITVIVNDLRSKFY